jgi:hypothetical protein
MPSTTYGNPNEMNYPSVKGLRVVGVKKNGQGDIEMFQVEDGDILSYQEVADAIEEGEATGLLTQRGNEGQLVIRSAPDAHSENNLDNIPTFQ